MHHLHKEGFLKKQMQKGFSTNQLPRSPQISPRSVRELHDTWDASLPCKIVTLKTRWFQHVFHPSENRSTYHQPGRASPNCNGCLVGGFLPIWKICSSNWISPQVGMKIKNVWNHHLVTKLSHWVANSKLRFYRTFMGFSKAAQLPTTPNTTFFPGNSRVFSLRGWWIPSFVIFFESPKKGRRPGRKKPWGISGGWSTRSLDCPGTDLLGSMGDRINGLFHPNISHL